MLRSRIEFSDVDEDVTSGVRSEYAAEQCARGLVALREHLRLLARFCRHDDAALVQRAFEVTQAFCRPQLEPLALQGLPCPIALGPQLVLFRVWDLGHRLDVDQVDDHHVARGVEALDLAAQHPDRQADLLEAGRQEGAVLAPFESLLLARAARYLCQRVVELALAQMPVLSGVVIQLEGDAAVRVYLQRLDLGADGRVGAVELRFDLGDEPAVLRHPFVVLLWRVLVQHYGADAHVRRRLPLAGAAEAPLAQVLH
mmetsp:Transcript_108220/g.311797  ORF Transcript_108220/g.311797 Transcript_108220/m.311797 type:complete len:256 (-) Transcript_108220:298-1065(-)